MSHPPSAVLPLRARRRGIALVIVLAFVVLVTGLVIAFFSRALSEQQISGSSANQTRADLFAEGAYSEIIGDLQQEIAAGSTPYTPPSTSVTLYVPSDPTTGAPCQVGTGNKVPNLVKRSANGQAFFTGAKYQNFPASNRAINVPSTTAAVGGRTFSLARWNKPLLLPKQSPANNDATPYTGTGGFTAPDWVLVARDGSNPTAWNASTMTASANSATSVVGRYAYAIYDEGGLLDANAAGYPTTANSYPSANPSSAAYLPLPTYKSALAYADLTVPTTNASDSSMQPLLTAAQVNALVGWRNYASGRPGGAFPNYTSAATPAPATIPALGLSPFDVATLTGTKGFLSATPSGLYQNQSDRMFGSRQQLIDFLVQSVASNSSDVAALQNSLQYLGTFNRTLNQPSYVPAQSVSPAYPGYVADAPKLTAPGVGGNNADPAGDALLDTKLNPAFPAARVLAPFARNDGTLTVVGEALVKKRFALNRLAWITCKGPSASRVNSTDADIVLLKQYLGGDPGASAWLAQGTSANIAAYFGLEWKRDTSSTTYLPDGTLVTNGDSQTKWLYDVHNHSGSGPITRLYDPSGSNDVAHAGREADFFELLKAAVKTGALGKAARLPNTNNGTTASNQYNTDSSVDFAVMQLGANIIDQFDTDNFPTRIVFNDGSAGGREFRGVENLPYINRVRNGLLKMAAPKMKDGTQSPYGNQGADFPTDANPISDTGVGALMLYPELWNPHDYSTTTGGLIQTMGPAGLGATRFRIFAVTDTAVTLVGHTGGAAPNFNNRSDDVANNDFSDATGCNTYNSVYGLPWGGEPRGLNQNNTEMDFSVNQDTSGVKLFREPTILFQPGRPASSGLTAPNLVQGNAGLGAIRGYPGFFVGGGLRNNITSTDGSGLPVLNAGYVGFYVGTHPLQWMRKGTTSQRYGARQTGIGGTLQVHYFLQSLDALGQWATYDEKYESDFSNPDDSLMTRAETGFLIPGYKYGHLAYAFDPRSNRFGLSMTNMPSGFGQFNFPPYWAYISNNASVSGWMNKADGVVLTDRNGSSAGTAVYYYIPSSGNDYYVTPAMGWHWQSSVSQNMGHPYLRIGLFAQNDPNLVPDLKPYDQVSDNSLIESGTPRPQYYTDADGVARRAVGGYNPLGTATATGSTAYTSSYTTPQRLGLPMATANDAPAAGLTRSAQSASRPVVLNRPFYSPADLGYVFSGTPWKNLDMVLPESGYNALLDVFCVQDTDHPDALAGGRVNLNTRQVPVIQAILAGAYKDGTAPTTGVTSPAPASPGPEAPAEALAVANALITRTGGSTGPATGPKANAGPQPLANVADLVGRWSSSVNATYGGIDGGKSYDGFSADLSAIYGTGAAFEDPFSNNVERFREANLRALTNAGQTRVWNLLIDVVAQTGRYPQGASSPSAFNVEGEQRFWMHVAIDRYTGQVLDKQVEVVKE